MSFTSASARRRNSGVRSKSLSSLANKSTVRRRKRPPWDNTVTNLDQYKATKEELIRRHEQHRPDLSLHRFLTCDTSCQDDTLSSENSPFTCRKVAVRKEYLSPETPLQTRKFLREIDQNVSLAEKSLPPGIRKYQGRPIVTSVPDHLVCTDEERSLVMIKPLGNSVFGNPSHSIVKQKAINDVSDSESSEQTSDNEDDADAVDRDSDNDETILGRAPTDMHERAEDFSNVNVPNKESKDHQEDLSVSKNNLNETKKKKKSKTESSSHTKDVDELGLMLNRLELEIEEFESKSGRQNILKDYTVNSSSVGGYTMSLLKTLIRVTHHMKEQEIQLQEEINAREQIMQGFEEQRALIDALTVDLIHTEEDNSNLRTEMEEFKRNITSQMREFKEMAISKKEHNSSILKANVIHPGDSLSSQAENEKTKKDKCESIIPAQQNYKMNNKIQNDEQEATGPSPSISPISFLS